MSLNVATSAGQGGLHPWGTGSWHGWVFLSYSARHSEYGRQRSRLNHGTTEPRNPYYYQLSMKKWFHAHESASINQPGYRMMRISPMDRDKTGLPDAHTFLPAAALAGSAKKSAIRLCKRRSRLQFGLQQPVTPALC